MLNLVVCNLAQLVLLYSGQASILPKPSPSSTMSSIKSVDWPSRYPNFILKTLFETFDTFSEMGKKIFPLTFCRIYGDRLFSNDATHFYYLIAFSYLLTFSPSYLLTYILFLLQFHFDLSYPYIPYICLLAPFSFYPTHFLLNNLHDRVFCITYSKSFVTDTFESFWTVHSCVPSIQ